MTRFRTVTTLSIGAALLLSSQLLPASAAQRGHSVAAVAASKVAATPLIRGVVTDQFGNHPDDVFVRATNSRGRLVASDRTYESPRPNGSEHGYFYLEVGEPGTYTLTLTKPGYEPTVFKRITVSG